jgi:hypothetical protein
VPLPRKDRDARIAVETIVAPELVVDLGVARAVLG